MNESIEAYALCSKHSNNGQLQKLIKKLMSDLEKNDETEEKMIIKLICCTLDHIKFGVPDIVTTITNDM